MKRIEHIFGETQSCFIIAEAGVNHNGDLDLACKLVDVALEAGADAVKFQTFKAERLVIRDAPMADYQARSATDCESQLEMLRHLELSEDAHRELAAYCQSCGILFLSTPFDELSADFLETLDIVAFKVSSGELTNLPLLAYLAQKKRPMIVSTGMACIGEVEAALQTIREVGNELVALLHCVSNYPASPSDVNLRAMATLKMAFGVPVGYSDHTLGFEIALAAVALGAQVIEKHFTLDRTLPGPDHQASLEPCELRAMIRGIRQVEAALGHGRKEPVVSERAMMEVARKSLIVKCDLMVGTILAEEHLIIKRPGTGLSPSDLPYVIGRKLCVDVRAGEILTLDMLK